MHLYPNIKITVRATQIAVFKILMFLSLKPTHTYELDHPFKWSELRCICMSGAFSNTQV
jgi:hypothetical protein